MATQRLLVLGGGFAGLWAAAAAARAIDAAGAADIEVTLVDPDPRHVIRVRCYEADLAPIALPLDAVLGPIGVRRIEDRAIGLDPAARRVALSGGTLGYDRLVLATGSQLHRPDVPGAAAHGLDVDTLAGGERLAAHLAGLATGQEDDGRWTAVVVGAGLVGIEIACELRARLLVAGAPPGAARVVLLDHAATPGAGMGPAAQPAIRAALAATGVEAIGGVSPSAIDAAGVVLGDGRRIAARTVVLATGMRASPLAALLPGAPALDRLGRLRVDAHLAVPGFAAIYAAGDIACARADAAGHETAMSCQHARPMGRIAGHNAACDLLGRPEARIAFAAPDYVTILDLGAWGAVYTRGWGRETLVAAGAEAKPVKQRINAERIYPPRDGDRAAILAAAAPVIQAAPAER